VLIAGDYAPSQTWNRLEEEVTKTCIPWKTHFREFWLENKMKKATPVWRRFFAGYLYEFFK
jgi:hypothetical protein